MTHCLPPYKFLFYSKLYVYLIRIKNQIESFNRRRKKNSTKKFRLAIGIFFQFFFSKMKYQKVLFLAICLSVLFYVVQYFKSIQLQKDHDHNGYPDKMKNKAIEVGQNSEEKHEHNSKADQGPSENEMQHIDGGTHQNTDEEADQDDFKEDEEQDSEQVDALNEFCVIAAIFNPASFKTQYERYEKFKAHILTFGLRLITIELAYKNQSFQVTQPNTPNNIQLVTEDVLWYKENLINIAVNNSTDCAYIAWLDIELEFLNRDWVKNTIEALESYKLVQPFEMVRIKGLKSEIVESYPSFSFCHVTSKSKAIEALKETYTDKNIKSKCVSDFAWAAKKETLDEINGLFDKVLYFSHKFQSFCSIYSTRIDFFTNRTFSVPYRTMPYRYAKKKFVSPKNIRFAKSTVRYGTRKSSVREKVDARTVYIYAFYAYKNCKKYMQYPHRLL